MFNGEQENMTVGYDEFGNKSKIIMYNPFRTVFTSLAEFWHSCSHKSYFTKEEGRLIATKYGLIEEYEQALNYGFNPDEALQE